MPACPFSNYWAKQGTERLQKKNEVERREGARAPDPRPVTDVGEVKNEKERRTLLDAAIAAGRNPETIGIYRLAYKRWVEVVRSGTFQDADLPTLGRLVVGLGGGNAIETGLRLHHTYGVPVIPGSALKGLASHYCHEVWGQVEQGEQAPEDNKLFRRGKDNHRLLFGSGDDGGCVTFHDAWIVPSSLSQWGIVLDVLTPHHPDFQANPETSPPTDFDNPIPIAFLSVVGSFHVAVSWNDPRIGDLAAQWTDLALELLKDALRHWGVGGKTSSGYGRLGTIDKAPPPAKAAATDRVAVPQAPRTKRNFGDPARVKILGRRGENKGGYRVQEEGHHEGILNLGTVRGNPSEGDLVEVFVKDDDVSRPQYIWDKPAPPKPKPGSAGQGRKTGGRR